jgi:hypothetical protein
MLKRTLLAGAAVAALAFGFSPAKADKFVTLGTANGNPVQWNTTNSGSLSLTGVVPAGNQPQNAPAVISGANQPGQPAGFGYSDYQNNGSLTNISEFSTEGNGGRTFLADDVVGIGYEVGSGSLLRNFLEAGGGIGSHTFSIGLDVDDTGVAQTLNSFWFLNLTTHTVLASFTGGTPGNIPSQNNGNGFPDYSITGFDINIGDIHVGDTVLFLARMSGLNDGPDAFFIEASPAADVPEPSSIAIMGGGLIGMVGMLGWKRRRNVGGDAAAV